MKILVINTGSSSIKYEFFDMSHQKKISSGCIECIGEPNSVVTHQTINSSEVYKKKQPIPDHPSAMNHIVKLLIDKKTGIIKNPSEVQAVGHRVVHGGETLTEPSIINDSVIQAIEENIPLAPLHNPANLIGIRTAQTFFPDAVQVAIFDTSFHKTLPKKAFLYALPIELYTKHKIRRYGFHGTSHAFVSQEAATFLNTPLKTLNLITIHLGNGASMAAIQRGECVDTSMGMTPLEGLIMGTRSGDIDPAIPFFLANHLKKSLNEIDILLNKNSGLKGLCGVNDMREVLKLREKGNQEAIDAIDLYTYRIKKYIGAYTAILGNLDAVIFTGGIGENSPLIRALSLKNLSILGIHLDENLNDSKQRGNQNIGTQTSQVRTLIIPTNEELHIARKTINLIKKK